MSALVRIEPPDDAPTRKAARYEREAGVIRQSLGRLVGELERRTRWVRRRLGKPLLIAAALAGGAVLAYATWRQLRARVSQLVLAEVKPTGAGFGGTTSNARRRR